MDNGNTNPADAMPKRMKVRGALKSLAEMNEVGIYRDARTLRVPLLHLRDDQWRILPMMLIIFLPSTEFPNDDSVCLTVSVAIIITYPI